MDVNNSLFQAVRDGNLKVAKEIINTYGLSYSKTWSMGYALLRISTRNKHTEITKLLLSNGARVNNNNKRRGKPNDTPLHFAAMNGQHKIIEMLLDKGANIDTKNQHGGTALHNAVFRNKLDALELLLSRGASVNARKHDGLTCLHTAVRKGNLKAVEILLRHQANPNISINAHLKVGQTPLHFAAEKGEKQIIELLLKNGALVDAQAKGGLTPVYLATMRQKDQVVEQLLDHGANVDAHDESGKTILSLAVESGSLKMVELILKYKPDPTNKKNCSTLKTAIYCAKEKYKLIVDKLLQYGLTYDADHQFVQMAVEKGYTKIVENCLKTSLNGQSCANEPTMANFALHTAVKNQQYEITDILIKYGADVNSLDVKDKTSMYYATLMGDMKMVELLLDKGSSVKNCLGLLINAVRNENKEMVELLLKRKVNVKEADTYGRTALHYCALNELDDCWNSSKCSQFICKSVQGDQAKVGTFKDNMAKVLIAAGADVNARSNDGRSTLHCACLKGYFNVVQILFEHNAKMFPDNMGSLPIHLSAYSGNVDILKMLINKGADVNAKTKNKWTPLHFAAQEGRGEFLEYLLNNGARIDEKEENGYTALHLAAKNNYLDIVELLFKYGADIDSTDDHGRTALNFAIKDGNEQTIKALLEYGCDIQNPCKRRFTPFEAAMFGVDIFDRGVFQRLGFGDEYDDYDDYDDMEDFYDTDEDDLYDSDYGCFKLDGYYGSEYGDYDDSEDSDEVREIYYDQISNMLQRHIVMMKAANLKVKEDQPQATSSKLSEYKTQCEKEVEKLKSEQICPNKNVTFFDILSKPAYNVAIYVRNPQVVDVVKTDEFKQKFPIYSGLISAKIRKGIITKDLLERGCAFFDLLPDAFSIRLPYNCREIICSYLSDTDLRGLVNASKPNE